MFTSFSGQVSLAQITWPSYLTGRASPRTVRPPCTPAGRQVEVQGERREATRSEAWLGRRAKAFGVVEPAPRLTRESPGCRSRGSSFCCGVTRDRGTRLDALG